MVLRIGTLLLVSVLIASGFFNAFDSTIKQSREAHIERIELINSL